MVQKEPLAGTPPTPGFELAVLLDDSESLIHLRTNWPSILLFGLTNGTLLFPSTMILCVSELWQVGLTVVIS